MEEKLKGLEYTYGRGSGEKKYERIPMRRFRPRPSRLYDPAHAACPQGRIHATNEEGDDTDGSITALPEDESHH